MGVPDCIRQRPARRQKPRFLPGPFGRPRGLADGLDSAKIFAVNDRYADKNHAFCRPRGLADGLDSAKIFAEDFRQMDQGWITVGLLTTIAVPGAAGTGGKPSAKKTVSDCISVVAARLAVGSMIDPWLPTMKFT
jgi:hypothetical protein